VQVRSRFAAFHRCLTVLVLLGTAQSALALELGQTAPDFKLKGDGETITLSELRGQFVYVDFWASWCAPCRQSFPWMNTLQRKFQDKGLHIIAINLDESDDPNSPAIRGFLAKAPANFKIAFDPAGVTPRAYGVLGMPTSFLIGKDGKVIFRHAGFKNADRNDLENRIALAMAGQ
jgi:cytochrome c biogenesis protein CcmG, thiol:disulfide interchange protein DsbE